MGGGDYPAQGDAGRQGGRRRATGRVGGGTVGVCARCRRVCAKAARKIVPSRGWHGETPWIAKSVISPRLWESDKTLRPLSFLSSHRQSPLIHPSFPTLYLPGLTFISSAIRLLVASTSLFSLSTFSLLAPSEPITLAHYSTHALQPWR